MSTPDVRISFGFGSTWKTPGSAIAWTDVSSALLRSGGCRTDRGRRAEIDDFKTGKATFRLLNSDRRFDPSHNAGSPYYLNLTGAAGSNASIADAAALDVTGDLDLRAEVALADWTPATTANLVAKHTGLTPTSGGYILRVNTSGTLMLTWSNGVTSVSRTSTVATGITDGARRWIRATLDVDNGAGGHDVKFWTSTDGVTWTQLGATVTTAGTTSIAASTFRLYVGSDIFGANGAIGSLYNVEIRNGIDGTVVGSFAAERAASTSATSVPDGVAGTWTVSSPAAIAGTAGMVKPGVPVKVEALVAGATYPMFRGFAAGFPQDYQRGNRHAYVDVDVEDGFRRLAGVGTTSSVYAYEVDQDSPAAYWKLDESAGTVMSDSSGNGRHGRYDNPELGLDPLVWGGVGSGGFVHEGDHRGIVNPEVILTGYPFTYEAWVRFRRDSAAFATILCGARDLALGSRVDITCPHDAHASGNTAGALVAANGARAVKGSTPIGDDTVHHIVAVFSNTTTIDLYVDGAAETITTWSASSGLGASGLSALRIWSVGNFPDTSAGDFGLGGIVDEVAIYASALSAGRIAAHYAAGVAPWDGDLPGARIGRLLDLAGWPSDLRSLDTGYTVLGAATLGENVLAHLKRIEAAEQGRLFISRTGQVQFLNRYHSQLNAAGATSQMSIVDTGVGSQYGDISFDYDERLVYNRVRASRPGGAPVEVADQTSIDAYGEQVDSSLAGIEVPSDAIAQSAAEFRLDRYRNPQLRVRPVTVKLHALTAVEQAQLLNLELGHRVTIARTPQGVGSAITQETLVEGIAHQINERREWIVTLSLSPVDTRTYALWGTATWGDGLWGY